MTSRRLAPGKGWDGFVDAVRTEIPGATVQNVAGGVQVTLACQHCGPVLAYHAGKRIPPEAIAATLRRRGWTIANKAGRHVCTAHAGHHEEKELPVAANDTRPSLRAVATSTTSEAALAASATDNARRARRETLQWLEEAFDVNAGNYREGVSDATIAKETGLAVEAVAKLREEFYGPLKEPELIVAARAELDRLETTATAMQEQVTRDLAKLRNSIDAVRADLARLTRLNGWRN